MKKIVCAAALLAAEILTMGSSIRAHAAEETPNCKAIYSCDYGTGTVICAKDETKRLPIASMCKIMTLLLSFEAVDSGELSYDENITVSENAAGMGGSQVFLDAGLSYSAESLLKSIAVCSANDSCVAMAERIAGSEEAFIERMNVRAKELGAENTLFANCTGLPKDPQYSCARDVAVMLSALLSHEKYFELTKVWTEDFEHPDGRKILMTNTNKLIRFYNGCDAGKTGFTNEAGSCLAATAKRGDMRIISVVIGAPDSKTRNAIVSTLFDEAFKNYENRIILSEGQEVEARAEVKGSKIKDVSLTAGSTLSVFGKKGETGETTVEYKINPLKAPVKAGDEAGEAILYRDGLEVARTILVAGEEADAYSWWDALQELLKSWN